MSWSIPVKVFQSFLEALDSEDIGDFGKSASLNGSWKTLIGLDQSESVAVLINSVSSNLSDSHGGVLVQVLVGESVSVSLSAHQSSTVKIGHLRSEERVSGSLHIVQVLDVDSWVTVTIPSAWWLTVMLEQAVMARPRAIALNISK